MDLRLAALAFFVLTTALCGAARAQSLVYNGSFSVMGPLPGVPDGWTAAGLEGIEQKLTVFNDPVRGTVAQLTCTKFVSGSPASHAMLAQERRVGVKRGQWYRLRLWARGVDIGAGVVQVALSNERNWSNTGLSGSFLPSAQWEQQEFIFQGSQDLRPEDSRLQIWFTSTGTLWVSDVGLTEMADFHIERHPVLLPSGGPNPIPNSSFECGGSGWGCSALGLPGWGTQVFRLLGAWDTSRAFDGRASWRLSADDFPMLYFDYYEPMAYRVRCLLLGHEGWVPVEPGRPYVFSAYVQAASPGVPVRVLVREADGPRHQEVFSVGRNWQRVQVSFTASQRYACGFVGLDLRDSKNAEGTIWVDAAQFEPGAAPTAYQPRDDVETRMETDRTGHIFTDPARGLNVRLRAWNSSDREQTVRGVLSVTDFLDRTVWQSSPSITVGAKASAAAEETGILAGKRGFFRAHWQPENGLAQELRCAVIEPSDESDSLFGMNHAFGDEFLLELAHAAGLRWWRDWSDKWQTVQPAPDGFDFRVPDVQIDRVLQAKGRVLVLFPFPSAVWAAKPDVARVNAAAGDNDYLKARLPTAFKPERLDDFARYVRASVEHYKGRIGVYEVLNEPIYTDYALPRNFGYGPSDYVDMLRVAYAAAKAADPACTVVGGIAGPPDMEQLAELVRQGGLKSCDVLNYHLYPHRGYPESYDEAFRKPWEEMRARGEVRPIWMTEFGLYADDEPPFTPYSIGDGAMQQAMRPSELAASGDLVRFAAVFCAYGVRKVFYHAGTSDAMHDSTAGNMFFDYGGVPRKQYAAQAALSRLLGPDVEFVRKWDQPAWLHAYEFRSRGRTVVILWSRKSDAPALQVPDGYHALDLMGNAMPERELAPGEVPVYLVGP
jgi:hypothetical protein